MTHIRAPLLSQVLAEEGVRIPLDAVFPSLPRSVLARGVAQASQRGGYVTASDAASSPGGGGSPSGRSEAASSVAAAATTAPSSARRNEKKAKARYREIGNALKKADYDRSDTAAPLPRCCLAINIATQLPRHCRL